jgi:methylated-DNA-[protein]-cysteine S-methyltransferase
VVQALCLRAPASSVLTHIALFLLPVGTGAHMAEILQWQFDQLETPIGKLLIVADHDGNLRATDWSDHEERVRQLLRAQYGETEFHLEPASNPNGLTDALHRYFAGELHAVDSLPVQTAGTPFQREVWRALRTIPCGTTISYGKLAEQIGRPAAVRAVGLANGSNPISIVVPCHRVIGSDGKLTGYGGGLDRKRWLLDHEKCATVSPQQQLPYAVSQVSRA